ncbi:hypothetical protein [Paludisphaera soli]|uniref:hypothetical protein n=1 Tax=Paludisphaera soli TaxID=2712865 RepID=UPI0013EC0F63|nr:hypothetical protein [Paludisphaera soli]
MAGDSNVDSLAARIKALIDSFDFTRPGIEQSMGEDAAHAVAEDIASSAAELQEEPTGGGFPSNEPGYARRKAEKYGVGDPAYGFRTGQTFSLESLLGDVRVGSDEVEMQYGTGRPPERSGASGYISEADKAVTDREKMGFLTAGANPIHPYEIGPYAREAVREIMAEGLRKHLESEGG